MWTGCEQQDGYLNVASPTAGVSGSSDRPTPRPDGCHTRDVTGLGRDPCYRQQLGGGIMTVGQHDTARLVVARGPPIAAVVTNLNGS